MTIRGSATLLWNDGSTSTLGFTVSTDPASGALGLNASLTDGAMAGASATAVPVLVGQDGVCLLGGVRSFNLNLGAVAFTHSSSRADRVHAASRRRHLKTIKRRR